MADACNDMIEAAALIDAIRACTLCAPHLAAGPRPIVQFAPTARLLIIGQAPGIRVHQSGVPWNDASGDRLREWTGIAPADFYDPAKVALMPMGFCYPGTDGSADLPPRPECAPRWHDAVRSTLPAVELTLLVGMHAQRHYLADARRRTMTEVVRNYAAYDPEYFPLPHPSWRSSGWMARNPWFAAEVLPALRARVRAALIIWPGDKVAL